MFLVISGFLITSHLLSNPPSGPRDLAVFWGRRIRRLLPASFFVIVITVILVAIFEPVTSWRVNSISAITSSLYVVNWNLALMSVDYLAPANAASALQHYWSLSVEEQFYLVWPIIVGATFLVARRWHARFRMIAGLTMLIVTLVSLTWSGYYTGAHPAPAYFVTTTRMWELGMGALLSAIYPTVKSRLAKLVPLRLILVAIGGISIITAAAFFTGEAFPGVIALVPVLGACMIICAGPMDDRPSFDSILGLYPLRILGDISYSVYLWHWPLIAIAVSVWGAALRWPTKLGLIAVTLCLSWATKRFVEDRFRGMHPLGVPLRRTFVFLVIGMMAATGSGIGLLVAHRVIAGPSGPPIIPVGSKCVGAANRIDLTCRANDPHGDHAYMTPYQAAADQGRVWADNCFWKKDSPFEWPICTYGSTNASAPKIALFGNSHAGPYAEPLAELSTENGWGLRTYLATNCFPSTISEVFPTQAMIEGCKKFSALAMQDMVLQRVKTVVLSSRTWGYLLEGYPVDDQQRAQKDMFTSLIDEFVFSGISVIVIRDVPLSAIDIQGCLAKNKQNVSACDEVRDVVLKPDPLFDAAVSASSPLVSTVDFTEALCNDTKCWNMVGGVVVYFDNGGHLTNTFAKTLKPYLEQVVGQAMAA